MHRFGEMFQKLAAQKEVSLSEVARETGILKSTLSRMVNKGDPKASDLIAIATYFGVSLEYLLLGEEARDTFPLKTQEELVDYVAERREQMEEIARKLEDLNAAVDRILEK